MQLDVGDCRIACTVTGAGPALLLMHGAEGNHHMFDGLVDYLAPYFTVIAYDQRDCGDTANPERPTTLAELADDAVGLLKALGHDTAHVYGTSFGGRVAQALAHRSPRSINKLVLGSSWPLPQSIAQLNPEGLQAIQALRARLPESAEALAEYFLPAQTLRERPELKGIFRNAQPHTERSIRRQQAVGECPLLEPRELRVPTLVLAGELDRVVPPHVTLALGEAIPGARTVLLPGVGHAGAVQAPALIATQIRNFCAPAAGAEV